MAQRLDNRTWLEGETRLTDKQVIALRAAAAGKLRRSDQGWFADGGFVAVSPATIAHLERRLLIEIATPPGTHGKGSVTGSGRALLAKIDAAGGL